MSDSVHKCWKINGFQLDILLWVYSIIIPKELWSTAEKEDTSPKAVFVILEASR